VFLENSICSKALKSTQVSDNGTQITIYNNDRSSSRTSNAICYKDPTVTSNGTQINAEWVPGERVGKIGAVSRTQTEWILKQDTNYLIRFTPGTDNAKASIVMEFYELTVGA